MVVKARKQKTDFRKIVIKLDNLYSELIRRRAILRRHGCERCGRWKSDWKELQAHHFCSREHFTTRWDERNGVGLCGGCHRHVQANDDVNKELLARVLPDEYEREGLYVLTNMTTKQCPVDYKAVEVYLREMIRRLRDGVQN